MENLEKKLHSILLEVVPELHDLEEQAHIIATASYLYNEKHGNYRVAKTITQEKQAEARLVTALLDAVDELTLGQYADESEISIDGTGLTAEQIVRQASYCVASKNGPRNFLGSELDILNEDDLDQFLTTDENVKQNKMSNYQINDSQPRHNPELYQAPGLPRHRSDSLNRS